jgi:histidine triad (HIT) family protein
MTGDRSCLFCNMASGDFEVTKLHEDGLVFAIADIAPRAPTHILVIPKQHIPSAEDVTADQAPLLGHMVVVAQQLARSAGIDRRGYRLAVNTGDDGGQSIYHLHMHLLGGRKLGAEG